MLRGQRAGALQPAEEETRGNRDAQGRRGGRKQEKKTVLVFAQKRKEEEGRAK